MNDPNEYPERAASRRRSTIARATALYATIAALEVDRVDPGYDLDAGDHATPFRLRPWTLELDPSGFAATIALDGEAWLAVPATELSELLEVSLRAGATVEAGNGIRVRIAGLAS